MLSTCIFLLYIEYTKSSRLINEKIEIFEKNFSYSKKWFNKPNIKGFIIAIVYRLVIICINHSLIQKSYVVKLYIISNKVFKFKIIYKTVEGLKIILREGENLISNYTYLFCWDNRKKYWQLNTCSIY